jgi:hypothetical protein
MLVHLLHFVVMWMNNFPSSTEISSRWSPRELVLWHHLDYKHHCWAPFGAYCKVHEHHDKERNLMKPCSIPAICLSPTGNIQGSTSLLVLSSNNGHGMSSQSRDQLLIGLLPSLRTVVFPEISSLPTVNGSHSPGLTILLPPSMIPLLVFFLMFPLRLRECSLTAQGRECLLLLNKMIHQSTIIKIGLLSLMLRWKMPTWTLPPIFPHLPRLSRLMMMMMRMVLLISHLPCAKLSIKSLKLNLTFPPPVQPLSQLPNHLAIQPVLVLLPSTLTHTIFSRQWLRTPPVTPLTLTPMPIKTRLILQLRTRF